MTQKIKLGIIKETKVPIDRRVPLTPEQVLMLMKKHKNAEVFVQPSDIRCYSDKEYSDLEIPLMEDLSNCDILVGVKEVKLQAMIPEKIYLFFSHTTKKQEYNRELLQEVIKKKITLVDYEHLTDNNNNRLVAFGYWAGVVGSYNGIIGWGLRTGDYKIKRAYECLHMKDMFSELKKVKLGNIKILITGGGRVAHGAMETLAALNLKKVSPEDYLIKTFNEPVYTQLDPDYYVRRKDGGEFDLYHFFDNPAVYESTFLPYTRETDIYIPCHFWDEKSPVFMTREEMTAPGFRIKLIADVSCDILTPIPSTLRASTIDDPFYGYNPETGKEEKPFGSDKNITVMAVDNLPAELPRDASGYFGERLIDEVFPAIFSNDKSGIINRATIVKKGVFTEKYSYLQDFANGK